MRKRHQTPTIRGTLDPNHPVTEKREDAKGLHGSTIMAFVIRGDQCYYSLNSVDY